MLSFDQNFKTPEPVGNVLKERNDPVYVSESYSLDSWIEIETLPGQTPSRQTPPPRKAGRHPPGQTPRDGHCRILLECILLSKKVLQKAEGCWIKLSQPMIFQSPISYFLMLRDCGQFTAAFLSIIGVTFHRAELPQTSWILSRKILQSKFPRNKVSTWFPSFRISRL